jgi:hypothetical protein
MGSLNFMAYRETVGERGGLTGERVRSSEAR